MEGALRRRRRQMAEECGAGERSVLRAQPTHGEGGGVGMELKNRWRLETGTACGGGASPRPLYTSRCLEEVYYSCMGSSLQRSLLRFVSIFDLCVFGPIRLCRSTADPLTNKPSVQLIQHIKSVMFIHDCRGSLLGSPIERRVITSSASEA